MHYIPQTRDPEIPQLLVPFVGESVTLASRWIDQKGLFWIVIDGWLPAKFHDVAFLGGEAHIREFPFCGTLKKMARQGNLLDSSTCSDLEMRT